MLTNLKRWLRRLTSALPAFKTNHTLPRVLHRSDHTISRREISNHALKVLYRIHEAGYQAYLVGGGVRDVLLGHHPKDFDVATNARPEEIAALFRNSRLIGRRFRLVHVHFGRQIVEVATFRSAPSEKDDDPSLARASDEGMIVRDNVFGSLEDDVFRRDFTINALYYRISDFAVIDYVGGLKDLKAGVLRIIGDPLKRYREDPVRMLRSIRFAAKLNFRIEPTTEKPLFELGHLLTNVASARLFDEYIKLFLSGFSLNSFHLLRRYGFFAVLFPKTDEILNTHESKQRIEQFILTALSNTDERVNSNKTVSSHFLLATFLWFPALAEAERHKTLTGVSHFEALQVAFEYVLHEQRKTFSIPRRLTQIVKEIWNLQLKLKKRGQHRAAQMYAHPCFRAGYDFLMLRAKANVEDPEAEILAQWWSDYIAADEPSRTKMAAAVKSGGPQRRKWRKGAEK
jgi:poly(A) polymerase